ncbi:MAG: sigma-54-dependent transcriptional regulator [bacterium]
MKRPDIFIVDDDVKFGKYMKKFLQQKVGENLEIIYISKIREAIERIKKENPKIALIDIVFENDPVNKNGLEIIERIASVVDTDFIVVTGGGTLADFFRAGQLAVKGIWEKEWDFTPLVELTSQLLKDSSRKEGLIEFKNFPTFIKEDPQSKIVWKNIETAAQSDLPVLITGETGVGKDVAARLIHMLSKRKNKPFRIFDAGAIEPSLVARELFGNEKGAFTGADKAYKGLFREADCGSLFIDEISNMNLENQKYLLRALNNPQKIRPIGSSAEVEVNVRIILATNKNLATLVNSSDFRQDLYSRIDNPLRIHIPPLCKRRKDIPALMDYFVRSLKLNHRPTVNFTEQAKSFLIQDYSWPMNVRQLEQFIGGMGVKYGDQGIVDLKTVRENLKVQSISEVSESNFPDDPESTKSLKQIKNQAEKNAVINSLKLSDFNISQAARKLDISREHLYRLIDKHQLKDWLENNK